MRSMLRFATCTYNIMVIVMCMCAFVGITSSLGRVVSKITLSVLLKENRPGNEASRYIIHKSLQVRGGGTRARYTDGEEKKRGDDEGRRGAKRQAVEECAAAGAEEDGGSKRTIIEDTT